MNHFRVALFDVTSGTADEAVEIARRDFKPLWEARPGMVRYEVGILDDGGFVSFSIWETDAQAQAAQAMAHEWVAANLADRIQLREEHTGSIAWDEAP